MAFTVSNVVNTVFGDTRFQLLRVTADAATGAIDTSFNVLKMANYTVENMASAPTMNLPVISFNSNCSGVASNGVVGLTNCVIGGIYHVAVYAPA